MEGFVVRCSDMPSIFMQQGMKMNGAKHVTSHLTYGPQHTYFQAGAAEVTESERSLGASVFEQDVFTQWPE